MNKSNPTVFWLRSLSFLALWKLLFFSHCGRNIEIRFLENESKENLLTIFLFKLLSFFHIIKGKAVKVEYSFGNMRDENDSVLLHQCYAITSQTTIKIAEAIKKLPGYDNLKMPFPRYRLCQYLEKLIYRQIYPVIKLLCLVKWQIERDNDLRQHAIMFEENKYFFFLMECWPKKDIDLIGYKHLIIKSLLRDIARLIYWELKFSLLQTSIPKTKKEKQDHPRIAVRYLQGIDLKRRSDTFFYPRSQIQPQKILVYSDFPSYFFPDEKTIKQINSMGMNWVDIRCLQRKYLISHDIKRIKYHFLKRFNRVEKWLSLINEDLISQVEFWKNFFQENNIKVHFGVIEEALSNIAEGIALDMVGGISIGVQRSEVHGIVTDEIHYHPENIFFSWNKRGVKYLKDNRNRNDFCIVSGFPYSDKAFFEEKKKIGKSKREQLMKNGAIFIVAIYDNVYGKEVGFSKEMIISYYMKFLDWAREDSEIGLVIKSKKPHILGSLPEIQNTLNQLIKTGRCIQLDNVLGRLPSDAAYTADIAVGIGISSAASEAAIVSGCKTIHCDLRGYHSHLFKKSGYGKIYFDDLDKMMTALKRFKENRNNEPELGDFSSFFEILDPFCDGLAGERVGAYIGWLLESFDNGENRDKALEYANRLYVKQWGENKVIDMKERNRKEKDGQVAVDKQQLQYSSC